jgi:hypothetical protein
LRENAGAQFCPLTVQVFLDTVGRPDTPGDRERNEDGYAG